MIYVTLQFGWWLYLIFSLYTTIYTEQAILEHKKWMLFGEGSVFFLILILGIVSILRAFKSESELARQQENFVLSVTHELKTPISSVKLFLQTLKKRELDPEKRNEIYDRSITEINRLDGLVNNLLITRSIENKNFFLDKKPMNLAEFIRTKVSMLKDSVLKDHDVILNLKEITCAVDKIGFESIVMNILENSVKYSPKKSHILIELTENKETIHLIVKDEGVGIVEKNRFSVFQKFYREENEMTRKSKGTGLGLYITKFLVEQHHGKINLLENKPNGLIVSIQLKK